MGLDLGFGLWLVWDSIQFIAAMINTYQTSGVWALTSRH